MKQMYFKASGMSKRHSALLIALFGWVTFILRITVGLQTYHGNIVLALGEALGYFTMMINTLATLYFTFVALGKARPGGLLEQLNPISALMVFLTLVSLIYHLLLRTTWQPTGLRWIISCNYHTIMPIITLLFWWRHHEIGGVRWKQIINWYALAIFYLVYVLVRGWYTELYPYPFLNVAEIGIGRLLINIAALTLLFYLIVLFYRQVDKFRIRNNLH